MSTEAVRSILETRLSSWAAARVPALRVAYENVPFTPAAGETYLEAKLAPAETESIDLAGEHRGYRGVFQVTVVRPNGAGRGPALSIASELNTLFPMNGRYTSGSVTVQVIKPASAGPGIQKDNAFGVPVSIRYRADTI